MLCVVSWPGRRRTEVPSGMLHLSELQGLHRRWGHLRSGGALQALLVSPPPPPPPPPPATPPPLLRLQHLLLPVDSVWKYESDYTNQFTSV